MDWFLYDRELRHERVIYVSGFLLIHTNRLLRISECGQIVCIQMVNTPETKNWNTFQVQIKNSEAYSEARQTSKLEFFVKIVNGWKSFTIFVKNIILKIDCTSDFSWQFLEILFSKLDIRFILDLTLSLLESVGKDSNIICNHFPEVKKLITTKPERLKTYLNFFAHKTHFYTFVKTFKWFQYQPGR